MRNFETESNEAFVTNINYSSNNKAKFYLRNIPTLVYLRILQIRQTPRLRSTAV